MRLLCIDHFFEQDITALREDAGDNSCWSVSYEPFLRAAMEIFPPEVATGIDAYFRPEHAEARRLYALRAARLVDELYETYRFDCLCAPSDTFFWIRSVIERCQELGIPVAVLQKESTIPPGWLEGPAREWGAMCPFIADAMMVSSEHHALFWINAATDPDIITVTGQPRFDVYARPERWRPLDAQGLHLPSRPTVLFLTYDVNAYLPVIDRTGLAPWQQLRDETEAVLLDLARTGAVNVLIKGHPQPAEDQRAHLAELGRSPGVTIVDPRADVRYLLTAVDAVVAFQTTALLEALAAGRPSLYTFWSDAARDHADDLIPFHEERDALTVADSPEALHQAILKSVGRESTDRAATTATTALVERYIGPVDGHAGRRCWEVLENLAATTQLNAEGAMLKRRAQRRRSAAVARAGAASFIWSAAKRIAPVAYPVYSRLMRRLRQSDDVLTPRDFTAEIGKRRATARDRFEAARSLS
jgi:hypothetical protein